MLKGLAGIPSVDIIGKRWTEGISCCSNMGERRNSQLVTQVIVSISVWTLV